MERTQLLLRIDSALHKRIFNAAKAEEKSVNELATEALKSYLGELQVRGDELQKLIASFPSKAEIKSMLDEITKTIVAELSRTLPKPAPPAPAPTTGKFDWAGFWAQNPGIDHQTADRMVRELCPWLSSESRRKAMQRHYGKQ